LYNDGLSINPISNYNNPIPLNSHMLSVPVGDTPLRLTNSVLTHLSDMRYTLVCTQQMVQTCLNWFLTGTRHCLHEYWRINNQHHVLRQLFRNGDSVKSWGSEHSCKIIDSVRSPGSDPQDLTLIKWKN